MQAPGLPPERAAHAARLAERGARHVQLGLALSVVGTLSLAALVGSGVGPEAALSATDWIGAIVSEAVLVAAVLSSSRIARAFVAFTGAGLAVVAIAMATFALSLPGVAFDIGMPLLPIAGAMATSAAGSLLATITPAARAWHRARLAARAARKRVRSLADWRAAG